MGVVEGITAASGALGLLGQLTGLGSKKKAYSGLSQSGQNLQNQIYNYYSKLASQPTTYTPVNQGNLEAMNLLFNSYLGKPYTVQGLGQYGNPSSGAITPGSFSAPATVLPSQTPMQTGGGMNPAQMMGMMRGGGYYRPQA